MATLSGNSAHCRRPGRGDARAATPITADALGIAGLIARRALPPAMTVTGLLMAAGAQGATITVDGNCGLLEAITSATRDQALAGCVAGNGDDTIQLPEDALFDFSAELRIPALGETQLNGAITIEGNGATFRRQADQPDFRLIAAASGVNLTLRNLTLTGGREKAGSIIAANEATLTLEGVTVSGGVVPEGAVAGGAVSSRASLLIVRDSIISGNDNLSQAPGGGIAASSGATYIYASIIENNTATEGGGGISSSESIFYEGFPFTRLRIEDTVISTNVTRNPSYGNAAISVLGGELVEITNTTISGNSSGADGAGSGAIGINLSQKVRIINSTISGNSSAHGVSTKINVFGAVLVAHTTITENRNNSGGTSGLYLNADTANVRQSVISGNDGEDFRVGGGTITSEGGNIIGTGDNAVFNQPGDQINVIDPGLGPLEDNGGDQLTHEPLPSSVAVDNVVGDCGDPFLDQRGLPRPLDGDEDGNAACDAGAVEFVPINPIIVDPGASNRVSDSRCSLVEAIDNAEAGQDNSDCLIGDVNGPDIISLPPGATLTYGSAFSAVNGLNALPNITTPITIEGNGGIVGGRNDADFRLIHVAETGDLTINDMTLTGGAPFGSPAGDNVASDGGAVLNYGTLRLNMATVSGNSARRDGGGINNRGDLLVTDSTISGNTADRNGGGLYNFASTASLNNSTVAGNSSGQGAGGILSAYATLTVDQSTVSGNTGVSAGGIDNFNASLRLFNSTVATNASAAGGLRNRNGATADLRNNLIAKQTSGPNCANAGAGSIGLGGTNLADDASCAGFSVDADTGTLLGALADNGGPTFTHALMPGHPGVDSVPTSGTGACPGPNADQRGMLRPLDGDNNGSQACDVGAFEYFNPDSDDDGDHIPNGYETDNDLDPFDSIGDNGADGDPDGDGLINLAEFQNGAAASNPDTDGDGLGDAIDQDPANDTNACVADGNGDADFNMTAMSGLVTQCAAPSAIRVLAHPDAIIEAGSELQLYSLTVSFQQGASVPQNATVRTIVGNPVPGEVPPAP